jgi:hypothetical protein
MLSLVFALGVVAGTVPVFVFLLELIPNFSGYVVPVILIAFGHGLAEPVTKNDPGDDSAFAAVKETGYPGRRGGKDGASPFIITTVSRDLGVGQWLLSFTLFERKSFCLCLSSAGQLPVSIGY